MENDQTRIVGPPPQGSRGRAPRASLTVIHSQDPALKGRVYALGEEDAGIGRDKTNAVVIPSESASRRHARIFASGGSHVLVDLESTNGTLLNGKAVQEQTLRSGDVIRIGSTVLRYSIEGETTP